MNETIKLKLLINFTSYFHHMFSLNSKRIPNFHDFFFYQNHIVLMRKLYEISKQHLFVFMNICGVQLISVLILKCVFLNDVSRSEVN